MRRALLEKVRCPNCYVHPLVLVSKVENDIEVRQGQLICRICQHAYPIEDGIAVLFPALDTATQREQHARDNKTRDWAIERQRPYLNDNTDFPWIWPAFTANVQQGLAQIDLHNAFVLDVGAATCWSTRMICERGAQAVALDISTGMLRDGEAQFTTGTYFDRLAATMEVLPFVDETFDMIFTSATIHHSGRLDNVFTEFARCLKPGGHAVLVNEPVLGLLNRASAFGQEEIEQGMNEHIYRLKDYKAAAAAANLQSHILFPDSLAKQLDGSLPAPETARLRLMKNIWHLLPRSVQRSIFSPGQYLFGLDLVMVALKRPCLQKSHI